MNALLRSFAALTLVPLALWSAPASAHPSVVVVGGPRGYAPPLRAEFRDPMPCERALWVAGSWAWTAYGWQWSAGYWQIPTPVVYQPVRPIYPSYAVSWGRDRRPDYGYARRPDYGRAPHGHDDHHGSWGGHDRGHDDGRPSSPPRPGPSPGRGHR